MVWFKSLKVVILAFELLAVAPIQGSEKEENSGGKVIFQPFEKSGQIRFKKPLESPVHYEKYAAMPIALDCTVKVGTGPKPRTEWYKNGRPIVNNRYMFKKRHQILNILNSRPENGGNYSCKVVDTQNKEILLKRDFVVTIKRKTNARKPIIHSDHPGNHTVLVGSNLTLTCQVVNVDATDPPQIVWFKHDHNQSDYKGYQDHNLQNCTAFQICNKSRDAMNITLYNLRLSDITRYTCMVTNFAGKTSHSGFVNVLEELPPDPDLVEAEEQKAATTIGAVVVCVVAIISVSVVIGFFVQRAQAEKARRKRSDSYAQSVIVWTKRVMVDMDNNNNSGTSTNASEHSRFLSPNVRIQSYKVSSYVNGDTSVGEYEYPFDEDWEFDRSQLHMESFLGEGAFGRVMKATATGIVQQGVTTTVAVKMLKEGHTDTDVIDLVKEMSIMKVIGRHNNIINLLKVCTRPNGYPLLVIVEYAKHGNLKDYLKAKRLLNKVQRDTKEDEPNYSELRKSSTITVAMDSLENIEDEENMVDHLGLHDMLNICFQVAKGMEFLADSKCVHRDLAARNVLVCENRVYKIADFGMARKCDDYYYRKLTEGKMPVKWMPPESIFDRIFTSQSDVWSYGILLWEVLSFGETPYPQTPAYLVPDMLKNGQRLGKPDSNCPDSVYELMQACWRYWPEERPNWHQIVETTLELFQSAA